jgi:hypothetical protein
MVARRIQAAWAHSEVRWLLLLLAAAAAVKAPSLGLWFHSPDDWISLDTGQKLAQLDGGALGRLFTEDTGRRSGRPIPFLLWGLNWALFKTWAPGYYATNLLLNLLAGGLVWALAWRGTKSAAAAAVALSWFLFNGATNQGVYFLSARDDDLVTLFFLAAVVAWPQAQKTTRGCVGVGVLTACAVFSKATGLMLPAVLVLVDILQMGPRAALAPRRAIRAYAAPAVAILLFVPALIGLVGSNSRMLGAGAQQSGPMAVVQVLKVTLASSLLPFASSYKFMPPIVADVLRLGLVLGAGVLTLRARDGAGKLAALGAGWLAVNLVIPFPFLLSGRNVHVEEGRYLLLPSIGLALLLAAAVGRSPDRWRTRLAVGAVTLTVLSYALFQTPRFLDDRTAAPSFRTAARAVAADLPADGQLWVAAKRLDQGLTGLISSSVFPEFVPELGDRRPLVFVEGGQTGFIPVPPGPHGGAALAEGAPVDLDALRPESDAVLLDIFRRPLPYDAPAAAWGRVALPLPAARAAPPLEVRFPADWTYQQLALLADEPSPVNWTPRAEPVPGGVSLDTRFPLMFHELTGALAQPPFFLPAVLQSPEVEVPTAAYCSVEVDLAVHSRMGRDARPQPLTRPLMPTPCFAALLWTDEEAFDDPFDRFILLPACTDPSGETATARLDTSPSWRTTGTVRRLGLMPASVPGDVEVRALRLLPCP